MPKNQKLQTKFVEAVPVRDFYESFKEPLELDCVAGAKGLDGMIRERSLNRPALAVTGYFKYFAAKRIQLFGAGERHVERQRKHHALPRKNRRNPHVQPGAC